MLHFVCVSVVSTAQGCCTQECHRSGLTPQRVKCLHMSIASRHAKMQRDARCLAWPHSDDGASKYYSLGNSTFANAMPYRRTLHATIAESPSMGAQSLVVPCTIVYCQRGDATAITVLFHPCLALIYGIVVQRPQNRTQKIVRTIVGYIPGARASISPRSQGRRARRKHRR